MAGNISTNLLPPDILQDFEKIRLDLRWLEQMTNAALNKRLQFLLLWDFYISQYKALLIKVGDILEYKEG